MAEGAFPESGAPGDYVEAATFSRPWEARLVREALVHRGIRAWVDDAGMDNPYRTAAGVERVYVPVADLPLAREILAEAERALVGPRSDAEREPFWWPIMVGVLLGAVLLAFLPHGVKLPALVVLIVAALLWLFVDGLRGSPATHANGDRDDRDDRLI